MFSSAPNYKPEMLLFLIFLLKHHEQGTPSAGRVSTHVHTRKTCTQAQDEGQSRLTAALSPSGATGQVFRSETSSNLSSRPLSNVSAEGGLPPERARHPSRNLLINHNCYRSARTQRPRGSC